MEQSITEKDSLSAQQLESHNKLVEEKEAVLQERAELISSLTATIQEKESLYQSLLTEKNNLMEMKAQLEQNIEKLASSVVVSC